jgi:hypothetical protein
MGTGLASGMGTNLVSSHTHSHTQSDRFDDDEDFEEYDEMDQNTGMVVRKRRGLGTKIKDAMKGVFGGNKHHHEPKHI